MSRSEAGRRYPLSVKPSAEVATARTSIDERKFRDRSVMHLYLSSIILRQFRSQPSCTMPAACVGDSGLSYLFRLGNASALSLSSRYVSYLVCSRNGG
jgi:hypothetical protein